MHERGPAPPIDAGGAPKRIAMVAPPGQAVGPTATGSVAAMVWLLTETLVKHGNSVSLYGPPGTTSSAEVRIVDRRVSGAREASDIERPHVEAAFEMIGRTEVDLVHDHSPSHGLVLADRLPGPMVHTLHWPVDGHADFYIQHGHKASLVGISHAQVRSGPEPVRLAHVIPNPIDLGQWPKGLQKDGYVLWIGRILRSKAPHLAIAAAREAGVPLRIAGPIVPGHERYFAEMIHPHIDNLSVTYVGVVQGSARKELYGRALATLVPISAAEALGMTMIESLASSTPTIAFRRWAAEDVVHDGWNGFLVDDVPQMAEAIRRIREIDPVRCRESVAYRYHPDTAARAYQRIYREAIARSRGSTTSI